MDTIVKITGREDIVYPDMVISADDLRAVLTINLSNHSVTEGEEDGSHVVRFEARTGTKGSTNVENVEGNLIVNNTRIIVQGREDIVLEGDMTLEEVTSALSGVVNVGTMDVKEEVIDTDRVVTYSPKVGTKGWEEDEDDFVQQNTHIFIEGREDKFLPNTVMDAQQASAFFEGQINLSSMDVEEVENGDTLEIRYTVRTGTKG